MFVVSVMFCQVEVSATSWSLVQRSPADCGASLCVIKKPQEWGGHGPRGAAAPQKTKQNKGKFILCLVQLREVLEIKPHGILTETHRLVSPILHFGLRTGILVHTAYSLAAISSRRPVYWIPNTRKQITSFLFWLIRHRFESKWTEFFVNFISFHIS